MQDKNGQEKETPEEKQPGQGDPDPQNPASNPEGGGTGDPDPGQSPDTPTDGLTDAERAEVEKLEASYLNAQQKISSDGDEKAELRKQLAEKDATIAALANNRGSEGTPSTPSADDDPYAGIDLDKLREESPTAFVVLERQHEMWEKTQASIAESNQENRASALKETQYESYRSRYGLSRQQFDTVWEARTRGNHFDADSLLSSYTKVNSAKQSQLEQQRNDRGQVVAGNSASQPPQATQQTDVDAEVERLRGLKGTELENAIVGLYGKLPEAQVNAIVKQVIIPNT